MTPIDLDETYFAGAATVERRDGAFIAHRLPHTERHLFPSPNDRLMITASYPSGVRLRFETDATGFTLRFRPLDGHRPGVEPLGHAFDVVIDDEIVQVGRALGGATEVSFSDLPGGTRIVELWLTPSCVLAITELLRHDGSFARPIPDRRPLWVTWGSSLTHCVRAGSAARVWPAIVSRRHGLNLLNLGFGGQCHLDPMVARFIRDQPADYISLKLGINTVSGSVNARTYPALVTAAVAIIREKHPHTPIVLISPIAYPPHETEPNVVGYTMEGMRQDMHAVYRRLVEAGDRHLHYVDGLTLFSVADIAEHALDRCHPEPVGIDLQADRFTDQVIPLLIGRA